jgi:hypothetical protein
MREKGRSPRSRRWRLARRLLAITALLAIGTVMLLALHGEGAGRPGSDEGAARERSTTSTTDTLAVVTAVSAAVSALGTVIAAVAAVKATSQRQ